MSDIGAVGSTGPGPLFSSGDANVAYGGHYGRGSLASNPTVAPIDLTVHGSDWLWAVFAIMLATGLGVTAWGLSLPAGTRAFHTLSVIVLITASVAYFSMASDLGSTPIAVEFVRRKSVLYDGPENIVYRSIWYARYVDWAITTPALLLTLLLSTGLPMSDIILTIFWDEVMIITGLCGALVSSQYKWGYYTLGCVAMLIVFYTLVVPARSAARALGEDVHSAYVKSALTLSFLWFLYPIAWGLCDGGNVISTDSEMVFYGILDVLAKPGYTLLHLFSLSSIDYARFGLAGGHHSTGKGGYLAAGAAGAAVGAGAEHHHDHQSGGITHQEKPTGANGLSNAHGSGQDHTSPALVPQNAAHSGPAAGDSTVHTAGTSGPVHAGPAAGGAQV